MTTDDPAAMQYLPHEIAPHKHYSAAWRINHANPGHVRITLFVGEVNRTRASSGELTFRTPEFTDLIEPAFRKLGWEQLPSLEDER